MMIMSASIGNTYLHVFLGSGMFADGMRALFIVLFVSRITTG
jgi:hypothetical protein